MTPECRSTSYAIDAANYVRQKVKGGEKGSVRFYDDEMQKQRELENEIVNAVIRKFAEEGKLVAAICAAPSVLGAAGLLEGKHATCHPGFEEKLTGATTSEDEVVVDGNIITSRGMGTAIPFAFEIVRYFTDDETVEHVRQGLVYRANEK